MTDLTAHLLDNPAITALALVAAGAVIILALVYLPSLLPRKDRGQGLYAPFEVDQWGRPVKGVKR